MPELAAGLHLFRSRLEVAFLVLAYEREHGLVDRRRGSVMLYSIGGDAAHRHVHRVAGIKKPRQKASSMPFVNSSTRSFGTSAVPKSRLGCSHRRTAGIARAVRPPGPSTMIATVTMRPVRIPGTWGGVAAAAAVVVGNEAHLPEVADGGDDAHDDGRSVGVSQGRYREQMLAP